jgi:hypothetical protein
LLWDSFQALHSLGQNTQVTVLNFGQYYSVTIYGQIGISGSNALKYQAINNIIGLVGEACCMLLIDKLGRRRPLITGNLINMVISRSRRPESFFSS